jgi:hypothetical protein
MAYKRKTKDEFTIQSYYNFDWENITTEDTYKQARERLEAYNKSEPEYKHRIIQHRVKI